MFGAVLDNWVGNCSLIKVLNRDETVLQVRQGRHECEEVTSSAYSQVSRINTLLLPF